MSLVNKVFVLVQIHSHIEHKRTGSPEAFARKLNISKRSLFRILEELKDMGAQITYNKGKQTYQYMNDAKISVFLKFYSDKNEEIEGKL